MAKSDVGTITVYLEAISKNFDASVKGAAASVKKFQGSIKAGGMAFTEFQSKIGVVSAAMETFGKVTDATMKASRGDWEGMLEVVKTLPFGIGAAVAAVSNLKAEWSGVADQLRASNAAIDKQTRLNKAFEESSKRRREMGGETEKLRKRAGIAGVDQGTIRFQRAAEQEKLRAAAQADLDDLRGKESAGRITPGNAESLWRQTEAALKEQITLSDQYWDVMQEIETAKADALRIDQETNKALAMRAAQASQDMADIRSRGLHEMAILKMMGADQAKIDDRHYQMQWDIDKLIADQARHAKNVTFDKPLKQAEEMAKHERRRLENVRETANVLETRIAEAESKQREMKAQGPDVTSMSFSTAVGSIVLPDRKQANVTRREQLIAARKTNELIAKTNDRLMALGTTMP